MNRASEKANRGAVASSFGASVKGYEAFARVQKDCAAELVRHLDALLPEIPEGPALELGCGTGFVTAGLLSKLWDRPMDITDLSPEMVAHCRRKFSDLAAVGGRTTFRTLDAHNLPQTDEKYALIIGGFVLQWLDDPVAGLRGFYRALRLGGCILLSFPTSRSFPEWRAICEDLGLPFQGNPLPEPDILQTTFPDGSAVRFVTEKIVEESFPRPALFFRALKAIGADASLSGGRLGPAQMRRLLSAWERKSPGGVSVRYHVVFAGLRRQR